MSDYRPSESLSKPLSKEASQPIGKTPMSAHDLIDSLLTLFGEEDCDLDKVVSQLDALMERLRQRFDRDADEGLLEEAVFLAPWLMSMAESLRQENTDILQVLESVRRKADRLDGTKSWRKLLREDFGEFVIRLQEHEMTQHHLLTESQSSEDQMFE